MGALDSLVRDTLVDGLAGGVFAAALSALYRAPSRYRLGSFVCGVAGRVAYGLLVASGMTHNGATVVAAGAVVLVAMGVKPDHAGSPVVLVAGVIPLGASVAMFQAIYGIMTLGTLKGQALAEAGVTLLANACRVFTTSLGIAIGLGLGMAVVRLAQRRGTWAEG